MDLNKTQIYDYHAEHGKVVEFSGFALPVWYTGIIKEHMSVREACGVFDTSHMGRTWVEGPEAEGFLNYIVTNNVGLLEPNGGLYTVMCNPKGGIVDDLILYKFDAERFLVVYNASNRKKDFNWLRRNSKGFKVRLKETSNNMAMIAIQGPKAQKTLQKIADMDLSAIGRFKIADLTIAGVPCYAARTGYTGEDGFEVFVRDSPVDSPEKALKVWNTSIENEAVPCGLGARDSLRLEAGLWLYGNDMDESTNPLEAGLRWTVKFKKSGYFVGQKALQKVREKGIQRRLIGIKMLERGIPRHGYEVIDVEENPIGVVTSGGMSPILNVGIAMAYVSPDYKDIDTELYIRIRNRMAKGIIVKHHPFYDESKYGWKRDS